MGQLTLAFDESAKAEQTHEIAPIYAHEGIMEPTMEYQSIDGTETEVPEYIKRTRRAIGIINVMPEDAPPSVKHVQALITALIGCGRFKNRAAVWNAMREYPYERIEDVRELAERIYNKRFSLRETLLEVLNGADMRTAISTVQQRHYSPR
jgi:hypothetical protein